MHFEDHKPLAILLFSCLTVLGASILGNSLFANQEATISSGVIGGVVLHNSSSSSFSYYAFLKPNDRVTVQMQSNSSGLTANLAVADARTGSITLNRSLVPQEVAFFNVTSRGIYRIDLAMKALNQGTVSLNPVVTVESNRPIDDMPLGLWFAGLGSMGVVVLVLLGRFRQPRPLSPPVPANQKLNPPPLDSARSHLVLPLISSDLFVSRRLYFVIPIFFAITYSAGAYSAELSPVHSANGPVLLANLTSPSLAPYNDWLNLFPLVAALAAYSFSYERDTLILRSFLLNPVRARTIYIAKLAALLIVVEVPVILAILVTLVLFEPSAVVSDPSMILGNAPFWIAVYSLFAWVMIGLVLLPSTLLKKPIYAFVLPVFAVLVLLTEGFGLGGNVPWSIWSTYGTLALSSLDLQSTFNLGQFLVNALPSLSLSLAFASLSFIVFEVQGRE